MSEVKSKKGVLWNHETSRSSAIIESTSTAPPMREEPPAPEDTVQRFESELTEIGEVLHICDQVDLNQRVLTLIRDIGVDRIHAWEPGNLPEGLIEELQTNGIQVTHVPGPSLRVGLTGASAGVAETGSILQSSGQRQPQTPSLLTEVHIVILSADSIYETLPQVLNLPEVKAASTAVLISGPSRTADIEMTLTIGVHGPREVHVVCVE